MTAPRLVTIERSGGVFPLRVPLHSEDAEQAVIAALLIESEAVAVARPLLVAADFYTNAHRLLYGACVVIADRGEQIDPITLSSELLRHGELDAAGGKDYIGFLVDAVPTAANVAYHATIVAEHAKRRALADLLESTTKQVRDGAFTAGDVATRFRPALDALAGAGGRTSALKSYDDEQILALPPLSYRVGGLVPLGGSSCMYGPPGSGKSYIAVHEAFCVATGIDFFGRPVQRAPVVYVAAEGTAGLPSRVAAWKRFHGREGRLGVRFITEAVNLLDTRAVNRFLADLRAASEQPGLVIFDTLARCIPGGDENSAMDMGIAVAAVARIQQETNAAVQLIHHTGKTGDAERGSTALRGAMDSMIPVTGSDGDVTIECDAPGAKMKDAAKSPAIRLRLSPEGDCCVLITAISALQSAPITATASERSLLVSLQQAFLAEGATATEWQKASGIAERTFFLARTRLVARGYVNDPHGKRGGRYTLTDMGRTVVTANCNLTAP